MIVVMTITCSMVITSRILRRLKNLWLGNHCPLCSPSPLTDTHTMASSLLWYTDTRCRVTKESMLCLDRLVKSPRS